MIAVRTLSRPCSPKNSQEHDDFLALAPIVKRHAQITFRHLPQTEREEAIAEAVASAFVSFVSLKNQDRNPVHEFPTVMATFAVLHVKNDRHVGSKASSRDVLSKMAQRRHGFRVESLPVSTRTSFEKLHGSPNGRKQLDVFEEWLMDNTRTPVPDQVDFRIDFTFFLDSLTQRDRRLAHFLSLGHSGKQAADSFKLTPGRVTQLRQQWQREWRVMQGEGALFEEQAGRTDKNAVGFA